VIEIAPGETTVVPADGALVHALIGENRHPVGKLKNFDATLRGGLAEQVDVAALKFCYIDIRWNSDVEDLFARYQDTLAQLESDYPQVRFVHMTVPLTTGPYGVRDHLKVLVGRDDNAARERYNDLMREAYGEEQLFDLARLEATEPDGSVREQQLFGGYSSDGAHLNAAGSEQIAAELVGFLALGRR
jgi:lysophospholipase L1-like esterase